MTGAARYEFIRFERKHINEALGLLGKYLWTSDSNKHLEKFRWKYFDNPYTEDPTAIIALYEGKVIGFKGFFVTKWNVGNKNKGVLFISPADSCVTPEHRRKGLSAEMTMQGLREFGKYGYKFVLSMSANYHASQIALKIGYRPLDVNSTVIKYGPRILFNYFLIKRFGNFNMKDYTNYGTFSDIEVCSLPKPEAMYLAYKKQIVPNVINLSKDLAFFKWRFNNVNYKYIFYYYWQNSEISDYVVSVINERNNIEQIVDYCTTTGYGIEEIILYIIQNNKNKIIQARISSTNEIFYTVLKKLSFRNKDKSLIIRLARKFNLTFKPIPSMLIRPIRIKYSDHDWILSGIDTRNPDNWEINDICSDAF